MSLRPRFGDGGMLGRPEEGLEALVERDEVVFSGAIAADQDWDPFERTPAGLLVTEDLAREDFRDTEDAHRWFIEHGVMALRTFLPAEDWRPYHDPEPDQDWVHDGLEDVLEQQVKVAWLLTSIARLSLPPDRWDHRWMAVGLRSRDRTMWLAPSPGLLAHRAVEPAEPGPVLWITERQWQPHRTEVPAPLDWWGSEGGVPLTATRAGHIELVRRLLEPYVREAARFDVDMPWPGAEYPVVVRERRRWRSVLAPVYLQLLEGLRRVSEGQTGASWCRECRQPFLTLDARRSSFCTDRDRFRFSQRERRKRLDAERAAKDALARLEGRPVPERPEPMPDLDR